MTVVDVRPRPQRATAAREAPTVGPALWGAVCAVTFLMSFSVGRLLLGW